MTPLIAGLVCAFAAIAVAQTTHVVGPGAYGNIGAALAVATAGDVVLVHPGNYPNFTVTRGVTIRAVTNGTVWSGGLANVAAGETLHLVDLDVWRFSVTGGACSFDRCRFHLSSGATWTVLLYTGDARVHLQQCEVGSPMAPYLGWGTLAAIKAINSTVSAVDCSFRGPDAAYPIAAAHGGAAIDLLDSTFHGSRIVATGGNGHTSGTVPLLPGPALRAVNSTAWISDSVLTGGQASSAPGSPPLACPVDASTGRLARCTLVPASCPPPVVPTTGPLLAVHRVAPLQAGSSFQLDFRTEPNEYVGVFASFALATNTFAELEQPTALDLGSLIPLSVLVTDGAGNTSGTWALPPGTANLALWLQAVTPGALPLQLSPVAGGVVR
jgi:hypothetical protein